MAAGLANILPASAPSVVTRLEPHVVEVVVWYPFGAADEAIAAAAAKVAAMLAEPDLGMALADTPDATDESRRVATTAMVQALARTLVEEAREIAQAAVVELITKPGVLRALLPTTLPDQPGLPWLNNNALAISADE